MSARKPQNIRKNAYRKKRKGSGRMRKGGMLLAIGCGAAAMALLFIFGHDLVTQSNYFAIQKIQISGHHRISKARLLQQTGISKGTNSLSVNLSLARRQMLALPYAADASIRRQLPDTITISIREHQPMAVLDLGRKFLINTQGEIFKEKDAADPKSLPTIDGLAFSDLSVGVLPKSKTYKAVVDVLNMGRKPESPIPAGMIRRIQVDRELGLTIHAGKRIGAVKIGFDNYPKKYRTLKRVLYYLATSKKFGNIKTIDLKNLNRIVIDPMAGLSSPAQDKEA